MDPENISGFISLWSASSSRLLIGEAMIVTVRYAAKLAVYVASINIVNNHQKLNMILPDADIGLCSSPTTKHAPYKTIKKQMSNAIRLQHLLEK